MGPQIYPYLMMGITFITFALLAYGLATYNYQRWTMRERYRSTDGKDFQHLQGETSAALSFKKRFLGWLSYLGKLTLKDKTPGTELKTNLYQAGFHHPNAPAIYFGLRTLCTFLLPLPFMFLNIWRGQAIGLSLMVGCLLAGAGYFLPIYILRVALRRRQDRIDRALPDVLDLMIVAMEAGLALQATLVRVADEVRGISKDLFKELQFTNAELRTGSSRETALKNLAERTGVQSVKSLVSLMLQSGKMGTSIADALRTHADFIRVQRTQKAEEIAAKMPVKILFPMMLFIMPALFIVILGPGALRISRNILK
jgi:tight adherence protein C